MSSTLILSPLSSHLPPQIYQTNENDKLLRKGRAQAPRWGGPLPLLMSLIGLIISKTTAGNIFSLGAKFPQSQSVCRLIANTTETVSRIGALAPLNNGLKWGQRADLLGPSHPT